MVSSGIKNRADVVNERGCDGGCARFGKYFLKCTSYHHKGENGGETTSLTPELSDSEIFAV
ncbi:hypothetical protein Nwat_1047 [Nitrosococcus watsonii C-113]|uniref:Uncharacterized protein n=1 Tax=Nitrosococcus watsoni (strain C-113) TaxID=105559 RepID=D8K511_NITWC|nr:hypothetical protein Nwat_1047 [Nitrosococcus watsonii C-113]